MDQRIYRIETNQNQEPAKSQITAATPSKSSIEFENLKAELKLTTEKLANMEAQFNSRLLALENPEKCIHSSEIYATKIHF